MGLTYLPLLYRSQYGKVVLRRAGGTSPREAEMATTISTEQATDMLRAEGYATADITAAMNSFIAADAPAEDESGEWAWTAEDLGVLRRVLGRLGRRAARANAAQTADVTAEIVDLNDLVVVDDREVSFDTVEVRRGDVVLATIRVESSEDEAPYAAAVAEFGDVTWL